jgi:predicted metalloprotease
VARSYVREARRRGVGRRRDRIGPIVERLAEEHADAQIALRFRSDLELLVSVMLSAQTTDTNVNRVTERLFEKYRRPEDYLAVPPEELERRQAAEAGLERVAVGSFNDAQQVWSGTVRDYRPAKLVLFWDGVRSGCGDASAEMGPFYCPADEKVYIDLGFYRELAARFGAPGEFAQAYVIAHEVGHHLQNVLGIAGKVREAQARDPGDRNALSVRMELQADCLAGVWGKSADGRGLLDPGEIEQGLRAAAAVGDDRIQESAGGSANPDTFTHGSAEQRARWFMRGFETGDADACNTFAGGAE